MDALTALPALDLYAAARRAEAHVARKYAVLAERREVKNSKKANETSGAGFSRKIARREIFAKKFHSRLSDLQRICYFLKCLE